MVVNILIFAAGLLIYAGYGLPGLIYLACATALSYLLGLLIPKQKWLMWVGVAANAGILLFIKLQPLTGLRFLSVLGISYFTLQIIAYLVDVYKGKHPPERNFFRYALFVTYLPHLFSGPIERYDRFMASLQNRRITSDGILSGAARALWGGVKLLLIDARVGVIIAAIAAKPESYAGAYALAAMILYSLRLYTNFSGSMDLVLGVSRMLGLFQRYFRGLRHHAADQVETSEPGLYLPAGVTSVVLLYLARCHHRHKNDGIRLHHCQLRRFLCHRRHFRSERNGLDHRGSCLPDPVALR